MASDLRINYGGLTHQMTLIALGAIKTPDGMFETYAAEPATLGAFLFWYSNATGNKAGRTDVPNCALALPAGRLDELAAGWLAERCTLCEWKFAALGVMVLGLIQMREGLGEAPKRNVDMFEDILTAKPGGTRPERMAAAIAAQFRTLL
jgi:hypothetical protein